MRSSPDDRSGEPVAEADLQESGRHDRENSGEVGMATVQNMARAFRDGPRVAAFMDGTGWSFIHACGWSSCAFAGTFSLAAEMARTPP